MANVSGEIWFKKVSVWFKDGSEQPYLNQKTVNQQTKYTLLFHYRTPCPNPIRPMTKIPIIDISPLQNESATALASVGKQLRKASESDGFFYVAGHGVDPDVIRSAFEMARQFFTMPAEKKSAIQMSGSHRGFLPIGESTMEGYNSADQKESFVWGLDEELGESLTGDENQLLVPNRWPNEPVRMREVLNAFFDSVHQCSWGILQALAISLGESAGFFTRNFNRPTSRGSLIYYPADEKANGTYGVSPHSDFGCLTMLLQGGPGLSAQNVKGHWYEVDPIPGTFVVNIGDLLSRWTNGRFRSVPHFVVNKGGEARYSLVVFVDPDSQTVIDPILDNGEVARFEPVTCDAYISGRFNRSFAYRN